MLKFLFLCITYSKYGVQYLHNGGSLVDSEKGVMYMCVPDHFKYMYKFNITYSYVTYTMCIVLPIYQHTKWKLGYAPVISHP